VPAEVALGVVSTTTVAVLADARRERPCTSPMSGWPDLDSAVEDADADAFARRLASMPTRA
jgi:hypothetical protein